MPNPRKPASVYQRPSGTWYIYDGGKQKSTGTKCRREAEAALARYIAERDQPIRAGSTDEEMTVSAALEIYCEQHAPTVRAPERIAYATERLVGLLGALPLSRINGPVCRQYGKSRGVSVGSVRKELGVLQAAINYCYSEGYLVSPVKVKLPPKPAPRDRWLTRDEAARLLWAARGNPKAKHLCRYILIALHTGTRSDAILHLRYMANTEGGYVDLERGIMYRRGVGVAETKKRTPTVPIPRPLLAHMRRWQRDGSRYIVHVDGNRVGRVKTAWATAMRISGIAHATRHDLRHTAITWALQRGMDRWAASGFFGVSLDVLENVYGHHDPQHIRNALDMMERTRPVPTQGRGRSTLTPVRVEGI